MNAARLLDGFNLLGDEPETVQQVRKLVVGLAVSGRLVVTDEEAIEPADLLKLIEARKLALIQQGVLRKQSLVENLTAVDLPRGFANPMSFVRLGSVARIEKGLTGIMKAKSGPYPLVVTAEDRASCDHFDFDGTAAIVPLVSSAGHGKASLQQLHYQEGKFALGSILAAIFPHAPELISARFLFEYLTAFKEELLVSQMIGTANVSLSVGKVSDVPVPLVAPSVQRKVDELMALCDRLEAARAEREATRDRLAAASLPASMRPIPRHSTTTLASRSTRCRPSPRARIRSSNCARLSSTSPFAASWCRRIRMTSPRPKSSRCLFAVEATRTCEEAFLRTSFNPRRGSLRPLPNGWRYELVAYLLRADAIHDLKDGNHGANHPKVSDFVSEGLPFITAAQVTDNGGINYETAYKLSGGPLAKLRVGFARPGDVIYTHKGSVGRVALCDRDCVLSPQTTYYRPNVAVFAAPFLRVMLLSDVFRDQADEVKKQTTRDFVSIQKQYEFAV